MAGIIIFFSVSLIILILFIQKITFGIIYEDGFRLEIEYSLFSLILKYKKDEKKRKKPPINVIVPSLKRPIQFLSERAELNIAKFRFETQELAPDRFSVRYRNVFSLFSALTAYLSRKFKKLTIEDDALLFSTDTDGKRDFEIDLKLSCSLYAAFSAILQFAVLFAVNYARQNAKIKAKRDR